MISEAPTAKANRLILDYRNTLVYDGGGWTVFGDYSARKLRSALAQYAGDELIVEFRSTSEDAVANDRQLYEQRLSGLSPEWRFTGFSPLVVGDLAFDTRMVGVLSRNQDTGGSAVNATGSPEAATVFVALNVDRDNEPRLLGAFSTKEIALSALQQHRKEPLDYSKYGDSGVDRFDSDGSRDCCAFIVPTVVDEGVVFEGGSISGAQES